MLSTPRLYHNTMATTKDAYREPPRIHFWYNLHHQYSFSLSLTTTTTGKRRRRKPFLGPVVKEDLLLLLLEDDDVPLLFLSFLLSWSSDAGGNCAEEGGVIAMYDGTSELDHPLLYDKDSPRFMVGCDCDSRSVV